MECRQVLGSYQASVNTRAVDSFLQVSSVYIAIIGFRLFHLLGKIQDKFCRLDAHIELKG